MSSKGLGRGLDALLRRTDMDMGTARQEKDDRTETPPPCCPCPICTPIPASPGRPSMPKP